MSNSIQAKCDACEGKQKEETPEIQTKLTVGEPGDKYEQEADATAAKVVKQINSPGFNESVQTKVESAVKSSPGNGMEPPGDCSDLKYEALLLAVEASKKVVSNLGGCREDDDCPTLATKIAAIAAELAARTARETTCFRGGNDKHKRHIQQVNNMMMRCYRYFDDSKCPQELVGAMQEVVKRSRQLIEAGLTIAAVAALIAAIIVLAKAILALGVAGSVAAGIVAVIVALELALSKFNTLDNLAMICKYLLTKTSEHISLRRLPHALDP
ncbi:MAG: hypothetical protein WA865_08065 [Spirulinaceae cyanobacterium]